MSLLLAWDAARLTYEKDGTVLPDVEEALRRSIQVDPTELKRFGHAKPVTTLAFSPNGNLLVTSGTDNTVQIWDTSSQQQPLKFNQFQCSASPGIVFSANGAAIACARAGELRVWSAETRRELLKLLPPSRNNNAPASNCTVNKVALAADGQSVIAGCTDQKIRRWDLSGKNLDTFAGSDPVIIESGRRIAYLTSKSINLRDLTTGQEQSIDVPAPTALVATADGNHVAARLLGSSVMKVWDIRSLHEVGSVNDLSTRYFAVSPDASRGVTYDSRTQLKLWDLTHRDRPATAITLPSGFRSLSPTLFFSPDGKTIVLQPGPGPEPGKWQDVQFWDAGSGTSTIGASATTAAYSQDGSRVALAGASSLRIDDTKTRRTVQVLYDRGQSFNMAAFSADGRFVAVAALDKRVHLWDRSSGEYLMQLGEHSRHIQDIEFSPDSRLLVTASDDGSVKVWGMNTLKEVFTLVPEPNRDGGGQPVLGAMFSPDSKLLATASQNSAQIWDAETGKHMASVTPKNTGVRVEDLAFSPDRRQLALIAKKTEFWDISSEKPRFLSEQQKPARMTYSIAFTADGRYLVAPGDEGMKVLDVGAKRWKSLQGGLTGDNWLGMAISPDRKTIAGAGTGGTVIVWDLKSGKQQTTLYAGKAVLKALAYSRDGNTLYTLADDWRMYAHPAPLPIVMQEAQQQLAQGAGAKELTEKECQELLHERCPAEVRSLKKVKFPQQSAANPRY